MQQSYRICLFAQGAVLNTSTGAFSWQPAQAGTNPFILMASVGTTVTAKNVNIVVTNNRVSAVQVAIALYNPNTIYVSASVNNYKTVYNDTVSQIEVI